MKIMPCGPVDAKIMLVGDFPGRMEEVKNTPFASPSGWELNKMLLEAGLKREELFLTYAIRTRPLNGNIETLIPVKKSDQRPGMLWYRGKLVDPQVPSLVALLAREIELIQPKIIIAAGPVALWVLTGQSSITSWRGSILETDISQLISPTNSQAKWKVLATLSPEALRFQHKMRPFIILDLKRAKAESESKTSSLPLSNWTFVLKPKLESVLSTLHDLLLLTQSKPDGSFLRLSVDLETRAGHIACIGIAWDKLNAICIPLMSQYNYSGYWSEEEECKIVCSLYKLLTHPKVETVGQNFSYDAQYLMRHLCFAPSRIRDTMVGHHSIFSNTPKSLDFLSSIYCENHAYWKDDLKEWNSAVLSEEKLWRYNCEDCVRTYEIYENIQSVVDEKGKREVHDFQQEMIPLVLKIMYRGLRVDVARRKGLHEELSDGMARIEQRLERILGHSINLRSPTQLKHLFYDDLQLRPVINRKTGQVSTDDEALITLSQREPLLKPIFDLIADYRSLGTFVSTFIEARLDVDFRMRSSFNVAGTETLRFTSSKNAFGSGANLQNLPKGDEDGEAGRTGLVLPNIRKMYIPDADCVFFDIDLSAADLRIVVWESDETEMKALLAAGLDPYTEFAKEYYRDPTITKRHPKRQIFKSFAHGTHYLGTARGLAQRIGLLVHEADRAQKWYFNRFPRIKSWQEEFKRQVQDRRWVENCFGYRFNITDRIEGNVFNKAIAWLPQSTVACLINRAWVQIDQRLPEVEILLQVHDSLAGQYRKGDSAGGKLAAAIVECASLPLPYADPLTIPVGIKTSEVSWGDCG